MADISNNMTLQETERGEKRALILSEAIRLFNDQGYHDTRLEDVASRLGTAKTSISYHFKSKESLLFEAYLSTCDFAEAEIKLAAMAPTGLERVVRWIRAFAKGHSASIIGSRMPLAIISDPVALGHEDAEQITQRLQTHSKALVQFLREGVEDGSIKVKSPEASVFLLLSMQLWIRRWLQNVMPVSHDEAIDVLCDLICYGFSSDRTRMLKAARPHTTMEAENFLFDREARNKMKLEAFLRVGTRHLNRSGFRNLSVNDVAHDLGVTRGTFYYHFADKDALLESCAQNTLDIMENTINTFGNSHSDAMMRLNLVLTSLYEGHMTDLNPLLRLSLFSSLGPKEKPVALARFKRVSAGIGELIALGMSDGSIRPLDIEAVEHLVCGAIFGATRQRLKAFGMEAEPKAGPLTSKLFFETLFYGLAAERE